MKCVSLSKFVSCISPNMVHAGRLVQGIPDILVTSYFTENLLYWVVCRASLLWGRMHPWYSWQKNCVVYISKSIVVSYSLVFMPYGSAHSQSSFEAPWQSGSSIFLVESTSVCYLAKRPYLDCEYIWGVPDKVVMPYLSKFPYSCVILRRACALRVVQSKHPRLAVLKFSPVCITGVHSPSWSSLVQTM